MSNNNLRKEFEEARQAEFDLTDTLNKPCDISINEFLKDDIENNLSNYGMHIEEYPESIVYMDMTSYNEEDIEGLVKEYESLIMSNPSEIREFLRDFAKDLLDVNEED